jgi:hypothetical protein
MERSLHVVDRGSDAPLVGVCTACNRRFLAPHESGRDPIHRLTAEFNEHNCNDDRNQSAITRTH